MLEFPEQARTIYPSVPTEEQIPGIIDAVRSLLEQPQDRENVRSVCKRNGETAKALARMVLERL
jgi:hypothetical protein